MAFSDLILKKMINSWATHWALWNWGRTTALCWCLNKWFCPWGLAKINDFYSSSISMLWFKKLMMGDFRSSKLMHFYLLCLCTNFLGKKKSWLLFIDFQWRVTLCHNILFCAHLNCHRAQFQGWPVNANNYWVWKEDCNFHLFKSGCCVTCRDNEF